MQISDLLTASNLVLQKFAQILRRKKRGQIYAIFLNLTDTSLFF